MILLDASELLPPSQRKVYRFIRQHIREQGRSPTVREIAKAMGWSVHSYAQKCINRLEAKGLIERGGHSRARTVRLKDRFGVLPLLGRTDGDQVLLSGGNILQSE